MSATKSKGNVNTFAQKASFDFRFEHEISAVAIEDEIRNGTAITMLTSPRIDVIWIGVEQAALLALVATVIVAIEISTVNWFIGHKNRIHLSLNKCCLQPYNFTKNSYIFSKKGHQPIDWWPFHNNYTLVLPVGWIIVVRLIPVTVIVEVIQINEETSG
jgi:hypothetical protein